MSLDPGRPGAFEPAAAVIRRLTGLTFPASRRGTLETAVSRAMERAGTRDLAEYLARLAANRELLDDLAGDLTVGESYFFRSPEQFDLIAEAVLGRGISCGDRPLRLWSAGCAAGEEAYTLAILLHQRGLAAAAHILATDLSRASLARARRARYKRWSLRGVPDETVAAYFRPVGDEFELAPAIRDAVEFRYLNLAEDTYPSLAAGVWGLDLIVCRNVLIYFDAETVRHVVRRLLDSLGDDGWLVLGPSDPLIAEPVGCEVVEMRAGLAYRRTARPAVPALPVERLTEPVIRPIRPSPPEPPLAAGQPEPAASAPSVEPVQEASLEAAIRCYAERDYARAAELGEAAARRRDEPAAWVIVVRALANAGRLADAGRACAAALDRHRDAAELAYLHAVLLAEAGHTAEATAAARMALYLDRSLAVAHLALAAALARSGDGRGARRALRNAAALLDAMPADAPVPCSDGERAGLLLRMAQVQLSLLGKEAA